jgi:hypothetical protein
LIIQVKKLSACAISLLYFYRVRGWEQKKYKKAENKSKGDNL